MASSQEQPVTPKVRKTKKVVDITEKVSDALTPEVMAPEATPQPTPLRAIGKLQIQHVGALFVVDPKEDITPFESIKLSTLLLNVIVAPSVTWDVQAYITENNLDRHFSIVASN